MPVALGALGGAVTSLSLLFLPALGFILGLLSSERLAFAALVLSLPFDTLLTKEVGGFTVRLAHVAAAVLGVRLLINSFSGRGTSYRFPALHFMGPLLAFCMVLALGMVGTVNLRKSVGYLGWAYFDVFVLFAAVAAWVNTPARALWATRLFLAAQLLVGCYGLAQVMAYAVGQVRLPYLSQIIGGWPRLNAFHYEPQYYAFFSIQALSILTYLWARGRPPFARWTVPMLLGFLILTTFLSTSRSGWLGLCCLIFFVLVRSPLASFKRWGVLMLLAAAVAAGTATFPVKFQDALVRLGAAAFDPTEPSSTAPRIRTLREGARIVKENPFLGVGIGNYGGYLAEELWARNISEGNREEVWHRLVPANMWIEMLSETGFIGTGIFLLFLLLLFLKMGDAARRARDEGLASLIRGYRLALFMTFFIMYQFAQTLYRLDTWFLIGLSVALCQIRPENGARPLAETPAREGNLSPSPTPHPA